MTRDGIGEEGGKKRKDRGKASGKGRRGSRGEIETGEVKVVGGKKREDKRVNAEGLGAGEKGI